MALSRANATSYLVGQYGTGAQSYLVLANIGLTDTAGGLKEIIDDAWIESGVVYSDLATATIADAEVSDALALLRFMALRKIASNLNAEELRGDLKIGDLALSGLIETVQNMIGLELADLRARGLVAGTAGINAPAYLGGISISDVDARESETDRVPASFTRTSRRWAAPRLGEWP